MAHDKIRIGIVGVGNCASSLVQGASFYSHPNEDEAIPGLMNFDLGGYRPEDLEFATAFDVDAGKVGKDLSEAIFAPPNNTLVFARPPGAGVAVMRGPTLDGIGQYMAGEIEEADCPPVDVAAQLTAAKVDVLVSYLPVGSQRATEYYAKQALEAGCAFVNCMPVFIASDPVWAKRFEKRGLPIIGDDIKSQVGATIVHRMLAKLFRDRGVRIDRTYQLNFGGNSDFKNMLERERLVSKKISKTQSVTSQFEAPPAEGDIHVGPSDHVPWLKDRKWAHIRVEGTTFGGAPLNVELKLEVWDSPNSAGVVIDAVRCAKLALDRRISGPLVGPSSYFMKSPPQQFSDEEARLRTRRFIDGDEPAVSPARAAVQLAS